jgi:hypothetical protein
MKVCLLALIKKYSMNLCIVDPVYSERGYSEYPVIVNTAPTRSL